MRFRSRLMAAYSLLVTVIIILIAIIFETYNLKHLEEITRLDLDILSKNMSNQLDEMVRPMRFITEFLLSDSTTLSAINLMTRADRTAPDSPVFISRAKADVHLNLAAYCNMANFRRVSFFTELGDLQTSNHLIYTIPDGSVMPDQFPFRRRVDAAMGKAILLPPYDDPWDTVTPMKIFSVTRLVMGNNVSSYIEVQRPVSDLEAIYRLDDTMSISAAVLNSRGETLYSRADPRTTAALGALIAENPAPENTPLHRFAPEIFADNIAAFYYSSYTDTYTVVIQNRKIMSDAIKEITLITSCMALVIFTVSILVIYLLSLHITAPIKQLVARIEHTNLDNLEVNYYGDSPKNLSDEFEQLYQSYEKLLKRLNRSVQQEKQMSMLHLQAEFNTLQAQVNPHFLYNVLNVISHRGVVLGDENICEICEQLASMLRYSAGTSERLATVREEAAHARHYLFLLKKRYREKLSYEMDIPDEMMEQRIPKIVLQQFIENSVNHGFNNTIDIMEISLKGWIEKNRWFIEIRDNGGGFHLSDIESLKHKMGEIHKHINANDFEANLEIGGMGILNIYTRFLMLFGDNAFFELSNNEKGAVITIGASYVPQTGYENAGVFENSGRV